MRPAIRYQRPLLSFKSYKPNRIIKVRPGVRMIHVFRPMRAIQLSRCAHEYP